MAEPTPPGSAPPDGADGNARTGAHAAGDVAALRAIMARLRDPQGGCPWDLEQDFASVAPYTIEEAYEVAEAIERGDLADLRGELGDLLLQVVFHAQMAQEQGAFDFDDVVRGICDKMVRRHPHVFADATVDGSERQTVAWEALKQQERADSGDRDGSALAGIARGLPEWQRALKLQKRAARVGFDWYDSTSVVAKLHEEIEEVQVELARGPVAENRERLEDEIGDVLFVCVNLARKAGVDAGASLRRSNAKFERRFRAMEALCAAAGTTMAQQSLPAQEALWQAVKQAESRAAAAAAADPARDQS